MTKFYLFFIAIVLTHTLCFAQNILPAPRPVQYLNSHIIKINALDNTITIKNSKENEINIKITPDITVYDMSKPYGDQSISKLSDIKSEDKALINIEKNNSGYTALKILFLPAGKTMDPSWKEQISSLQGEIYDEENIPADEFIEDIYGKIIYSTNDSLSIELEDPAGECKIIKIDKATKIYDCSKPYGIKSLIKITELKKDGLVIIMGTDIECDTAKVIYYILTEDGFHSTWDEYFEKYLEEKEK